MAELSITRGLPGSGKTTGAEMYASVTENTLIIGRDTIRLSILQMGTTKGTHEQEDLVTAIQRAAVEKTLRKGWNVIVDDTNLPQKRARDWAELAKECGATFRVVDYTDIPLEVCLLNNAGRLGTVKHVPDEVIIDMHRRYHLGTPAFKVEVDDVDSAPELKQYVADPDLPPVYIFDIDGTLAKMIGRSPFDWARVGEDLLHPWVHGIAVALYAAGLNIVYLSGRDEVCRALTQDWLANYGLPPGPLFMRPEGDNRKDTLVKVELFWEHLAARYNVLGVFDDRDSVVETWRAMGVKCAQVAPGNF